MKKLNSNYMKKFIAVFFYVTVLSGVSHAQQQQTPQLLKQPVDWRFERFTLPPQFAPDIPYKGAEELRFSPGMFVKDSAEYFSYAFVAEFDNIKSISEADVKNYLLSYFKGLCDNTAKQRKFSIDTSKITVVMERKDIKGEEIYNALLNIFGVFADGAPVKLNAEIKVMSDKAASKIFLVYTASPHEKTDAVWKKLNAIQKGFVIP
jgi:hypothetical protein